MPSVIGTWLSSLTDRFLFPSGVMLLSGVGILARRIMVVEGEADHAKRRACGFARICSSDTRAAFASSPSLTGTGRDQGP